MGSRVVDFLIRRDAWREVAQGRGSAEVERAYREVLEGRALPHHGHVLSLAEAA